MTIRATIWFEPEDIAWIRATAKTEGRSISGQVGWLLKGVREAKGGYPGYWRNPHAPQPAQTPSRVGDGE